MAGPLNSLPDLSSGCWYDDDNEQDGDLAGGAQVADVRGPLPRDLDTGWQTCLAALGERAALAEPFTGLPAPTDSGLTESGIILVWDDGVRYCEVECVGGDVYEWFYLDRPTDAYHGSEGAADEAVQGVTEMLTAAGFIAEKP